MFKFIKRWRLSSSCTHWWRLLDYQPKWNNYLEESEGFYYLYCDKCCSSRTVNGPLYDKLKSLNLIMELDENGLH